MKAKKDQALSVRCRTCGAKPGEKCELSTGQPRTAPHRDRRSEAAEKELGSETDPDNPAKAA